MKRDEALVAVEHDGLVWWFRRVSDVPPTVHLGYVEAVHGADPEVGDPHYESLPAAVRKDLKDAGLRYRRSTGPLSEVL